MQMYFWGQTYFPHCLLKNPLEKNARRSLVADVDIIKGSIITKEQLTWKRPAHGVSPKHIQDVIGQVASEDIPADTVIKWNMLEL